MPLNHQAAEGKQNKPNLPAGIFLGGKVMDQNLQKIMDKLIEKTIGNHWGRSLIGLWVNPFKKPKYII